MGIFSGLEKFGLEADEDLQLFEEEKAAVSAETETKEVKKEPQEAEFLLEKAVRCPVCDRVFKTLMVKNGRVKRLESDRDLRPRHQYIDTLKYNVSSCPNCGYTALHTYFDSVTQIQSKLISEKICCNFQPDTEEKELPKQWDYEKAIEYHKLSLFNAIVKKAKVSEKAYNCLMLAWLLRGQIEKMPSETEIDKQKIADAKKDEESFYKQAYDGFTKAISTEMFPMCGMDQTTVEYLLATMAYHYGQLEIASKCLANIITSPSASRNVKNKALDLKDEIIARIRGSKA